MTRQIRMLQDDQKVSLPESLARSAGFVGLDSWMFLVQRVYGFPVYRMVSQNNNEIDGWLALVHIKHPIFGNYLTTSPFGSYGGFACLSKEARDGLLGQAGELGKELGVEHVNVRFEAGEETPPEGWTQHPVYATYLVDLCTNMDQMMSGYGPDHRNHIRKSLRKGFSIEFGHLDLLDDAYEGLARSMHELGSPYHSKSYLREMAESLGGTLEFAVVYDARGELAGAGVFISQGDRVTNLHANILRRFRSSYAGELLYWSTLARYGSQGYQVFDLGRSLIGSGNETFKMKWRPRKAPLAYWYYLPKDGHVPKLNQKNPKFQMAIWLWKHLPAFVVRSLGPFLIKGLA